MGGEEGVEGRRETKRGREEEGVEGRRETKRGRREGERRKQRKVHACVWVRERNGEKEKEGKRRREGGRKKFRKIQYHEDKAYPFSVRASEGSAVGHTSSCHKHIACNIADLILKFLRGAGERKRSKN